MKSIKEKNLFEVISKHENKKCLYGLCCYKNKIFFYKKFSCDNIRELIGYNLVKKYYRVPKVIYFNKNLILYEYIKDFDNKSIKDYLYKNNNIQINYDLLFYQYRNSLNSIKRIDENKLRNILFYNDRISVIDKYINNINYSMYKEIFIDIKNNITKKKKLYSFISQGDPTDTNITSTAVFCDFENGGYNSIVGEIAIFIISILSHGVYIYPKYNYKVYGNKPITFSFSYKNIDLLNRYLDFFKMNLDKNIISELDMYLKYYICFRIINPIDIDIMDDKDKELIFKELDIFYNSNSFDNIIQIIKGWYF